VSESCDYCGAYLEDEAAIRPTGIAADGTPVVKFHCGICDPRDEIDQAAVEALVGLAKKARVIV